MTEATPPEHASAEHASAEHASAEHASTEHASTEHASTEHASTEHASTEHAYGFELFGERHRLLRAAFSLQTPGASRPRAYTVSSVPRKCVS